MPVQALIQALFISLTFGPACEHTFPIVDTIPHRLQSCAFRSKMDLFSSCLPSYKSQKNLSLRDRCVLHTSVLWQRTMGNLSQAFMTRRWFSKCPGKNLVEAIGFVLLLACTGSSSACSHWCIHYFLWSLSTTQVPIVWRCGYSMLEWRENDGEMQGNSAKIQWASS